MFRSGTTGTTPNGFSITALVTNPVVAPIASECIRVILSASNSTASVPLLSARPQRFTAATTSREAGSRRTDTCAGLSTVTRGLPASSPHTMTKLSPSASASLWATGAIWSRSLRIQSPHNWASGAPSTRNPVTRRRSARLFTARRGRFVLIRPNRVPSASRASGAR